MNFLGRQKIKVLALVMALAFVGASSGFADVAAATSQDLASVNKSLEAKINMLEKKLDSLAGRVSKSERMKGSVVAAPVSGGESGTGVLRTDGGDIHMGGFIDTSMNWNFNSPATGAGGNSALRAFDNNANTFSVNNIQFELSRPAPADGGVGFKTVFMYGDDAIVVDGVDTGGTIDGADEFAIQQAYLDFNIPVGNGITVWAGKFATLMGGEVIENHLNWNSSRSFLFNLAIPFTHTGVRAMYDFLDGEITTAVGFVNGWDQTTDTNDVKDFEARVGWVPSDNFNTSVGFMHGSQQIEDRDNARGLVDVVAYWRPLPDSLPKLDLMANFDYGWEDDNLSAAAINGGADWAGYALYARYALYDWLTLAMRWEQFSDEEGFRTGIVDGLGVVDEKRSLSSLTFTGDIQLYENLLTRLEYRWDKADTNLAFDADVNGGSGLGTEDNQTTIGVSMIYLFG